MANQVVPIEFPSQDPEDQPPSPQSQNSPDQPPAPRPWGSLRVLHAPLADESSAVTVIIQNPPPVLDPITVSIGEPRRYPPLDLGRIIISSGETTRVWNFKLNFLLVINFLAIILNSTIAIYFIILSLEYYKKH